MEAAFLSLLVNHLKRLAREADMPSPITGMARSYAIAKVGQKEAYERGQFETELSIAISHDQDTSVREGTVMARKGTSLYEEVLHLSIFSKQYTSFILVLDVFQIASCRSLIEGNHETKHCQRLATCTICAFTLCAALPSFIRATCCTFRPLLLASVAPAL